MDSKYGCGAKECGEAYLYYGSALLELARLETGALDGVINPNVAESSEEDEEEEEDDEEEEENENGVEQDKTEDGKAEEGSAAKSEAEDLEDSDKEAAVAAPSSSEPGTSSEAPSNSEPQASSSKEPEPQPSTSKGPKDEEEEADNEASDMEIAWETLSTARAVFETHVDADPSLKLKLAETLQKLGEICIEWENNEGAIDLLMQSLSLRKEELKEDDRLIAETYYYLGLAHSFIPEKFQAANDCFQSAVQVLEQRISNLKKQIDEDKDNTDKCEKLTREISDLESLIPDMQARIDDSAEQMQAARKALEQEDEEQVKETEIKSQVVKEKPVQNITHLLKRKKPDEPAVENGISKKTCLANGNSQSNQMETDAPTATPTEGVPEQAANSSS